MPRPPILPYVYSPTGFRLCIRSPSPILDALEVAGADLLVTSEQEIEDRVNEVVPRYLDARQHAVKQPAFRQEVKALKEPLASLLEALPDDYSPLAAELSKYWQYGPALPLSTPLFDANTIVGRQTPIAHLKAELLRFTRGLEALAADVGVGKAGRVEALEDHEFVGALAILYSDWTKRPPSQGIKEAAHCADDRATGPFADFIRVVLRETHDQMVDRFCRQGKIVGHGKVEPLTRAEADELVGSIELPTLSSLIQALVRRQSTLKLR